MIIGDTLRSLRLNKMKLSDRQKLAVHRCDSAQKILLDKGLEYSLDKDCLSSFKEIAEFLGLSPFQVWFVYFYKHFAVIKNAIKNYPSDPVKGIKSETLDSRMNDLHNYLIIFEALIHDNEKEEK